MAAKAKAPDLSEFFRYSRPKKKPCQLGFILTQVGETEAAQLEAALAQDSGIITNSAIVDWAKARGYDVSNPAVTTHRQGKCTCDAEA